MKGILSTGKSTSADLGAATRYIQGPEGPRGPAGYTPQRGIDYWTPEDEARLNSYVSSAESSANKATNSANSATDSKNKSATSEANAKASETKAQQYASNAASSAQSASAAQQAAASSASAASASANAAAQSASKSATSEKNSASNATSAENSAMRAANSATAAENAATTAAEKAATKAANDAVVGVESRLSEYVDSASAAEAGAKAAQKAAEDARDAASEIAGGDFASKTEAQGYANVAENNAKSAAQVYANTAESNAKQYVDDIEIGGRNLFGFHKGIELIWCLTPDESTRGFRADFTSADNVGRIVHLGFEEFGTGYYTVSADVYASTNCNISIDICDGPSADFSLTTTPRKIVHTAYVDRMYDGEMDGFFDVVGTAGIAVYFANVKVERGVKATSWTPAVEDVEYEIGNITAADVGAPTVAEMNEAISAIPTPDVSGQINAHNADASAHASVLLPLSGGTMTGALDAPAVGKDGYIAYPDGGYLNADYEGTTGRLKITLPAKGDTQTMLRFNVKLYSYYYSTVSEYVIGGFLSGGWQQSLALCAAPKNRNLSNLTVSLCANGDERYVLIGELNTNWMYSKIAVTDVVVGQGGSKYESWKSGWKVEIVNEDAPAGSITFNNTNFANGITAADVGALPNTEPVPIEKGGTGAVSAADARTNLGITPGNIGAAETFHYHDAAWISSGVFPVARGGTGASDAAAARTNLGAAPMYTYGTEDLEAGVTALESGKLHFVYE